MFMNIRQDIWKSLKYIAMIFDVHYMQRDFLVFSKFQNLTTVSVVLPGPKQRRGKSYRLVDVPWRGCTHNRLEESGRDLGDTATSMGSAPCCSDCQ